MPHFIERSAVTTEFVTQLRTLGFPVGDNSSPTDASNNPVPFGWQGEADAAGTNFVPWFSLTPMPGSAPQQNAPGTLNTLASDSFWILNYSLYMAGVNRNQTELLADKARNLFCNLGLSAQVNCTGALTTWHIAGVECSSLGTNQRVGEATPYYYTQTDNYQVWVTEGD